MRTIWKYELPLEGEVTIAIPPPAEVLAVEDVGGHLFLWAIVDTEISPAPQTFAVVGTGHPLPDMPSDVGRTHVGTVLQAGGAFVWHVFHVQEIPF